MPLPMLFAEWRFLRTGEEGWRILARRWTKAFAVLFAVGAVSGTVLSFKLGLLWPSFMGTIGSVIGLPFTLEGFAFFLEAIFAGIYLYGWDRLPSRIHWLTGLSIAVSGVASAWLVVTANAWMKSPQGFTLSGGVVVDVDPLAARLNPATGAQTLHMILAASMVTGFVVAAFYAWERLQGRDGRPLPASGDELGFGAGGDLHTGANCGGRLGGPDGGGEPAGQAGGNGGTR